MEGSFADAANNHGFKRSRWRRSWRQQIQDYLIAAIQNIRILLARTVLQPAASAVLALPGAVSLQGASLALHFQTPGGGRQLEPSIFRAATRRLNPSPGSRN
jgi:hypothetical protein